MCVYTHAQFEGKFVGFILNFFRLNSGGRNLRNEEEDERDLNPITLRVRLIKLKFEN